MKPGSRLVTVALALAAALVGAAAFNLLIGEFGLPVAIAGILLFTCFAIFVNRVRQGIVAMIAITSAIELCLRGVIH